MRWVVAVVAVVLVVGLLVWARGAEHHHGDDVGVARSGTARDSPADGR